MPALPLIPDSFSCSSCCFVDRFVFDVRVELCLHLYHPLRELGVVLLEPVEGLLDPVDAGLDVSDVRDEDPLVLAFPLPIAVVVAPEGEEGEYDGTERSGHRDDGQRDFKCVHSCSSRYSMIRFRDS